MIVTVNEQPVEIAENSNIEALLKHLNTPLDGTAVAINQVIVHRATWQDYPLSDGAQISLFQAIAGG